MRTPANVTTRSKEGPRFVDGRPEPFTLANPHQQTILRALETFPFNPRWMARFELESGDYLTKALRQLRQYNAVMMAVWNFKEYLVTALEDYQTRIKKSQQR